MNIYDIIEKIGEGTYGKVYKARNKRTRKLIAIKKTRILIDAEGVPSVVLREASLLHMLCESNNIIKLLKVECFNQAEKQYLYLVFEYLTTDLKKWVDLNGWTYPCLLPKQLVKSMMLQLIRGVSHCHKHGVLHRDLKPQNLLIAVNPSNPFLSQLKIADFGLSRVFSIPIQSYTTEIVTLWYRAPEILLSAVNYGLGVDIWSIGCIFGELINNYPLFPGDSEVQQLLYIFKLFGTPSIKTLPNFKQMRDWHDFPMWIPQNLDKIFPTLEPNGVILLRKMFTYDLCRRISAKEAENHVYFDSIRAFLRN
jgi:cyclin-dependent kinase